MKFTINGFVCSQENAQTGCFTVICKETLFAFVVSGKGHGNFTL